MRRLTRKGKRIRNKKILMVSTICLLLCLSIGYAAFSTSLSLKAKGNIKTKTYTSQEIKDIFCNGENDSGLYKDIYEDGKCTYRGSSPNNYITFNNETWRIISIDANNFIKIIKNESIGSRAEPYPIPGRDHRRAEGDAADRRRADRRSLPLCRAGSIGVQR